MIAEYFLITGVLFLFFGILWSKDSFSNVAIKAILFCFSSWAFYALFGPMNLATKFIH